MKFKKEKSMTELVWIHKFNANELGIASNGGTGRGAFCLVPVDARQIFFSASELTEIDNGENKSINLLVRDSNKLLNYSSPKSKTEHRLSFAGMSDLIGEENTNSYITPNKIGCFYKQNNTVHLLVFDASSAYGQLLSDFPQRGKTNNLVTKTVFNSNNEDCTSKQTIFYGSPGSGKSRKVKQITEHENKTRITFHPEMDYQSFVGAYKPVTDDSGKITYSFVPQAFAKAYCEAWKNPDQNYYLIIEEINRGNCAEIFGDLFQSLDRSDDGFSEYELEVSKELSKFLKSELDSLDKEQLEQYKSITTSDDSFNKIKLPNNLSILATMNTSDQSLYPMDSAFKRRWEWEYVPINYEDANTLTININDSLYNWGSFIKTINQKILETTDSEDKQIGNRFCKADSNGFISQNQFISKVLFYLWSEVYKDEHGTSETIFQINKDVDDFQQLTFSDFFGSESDVAEKIELFMTFNGIEKNTNNEIESNINDENSI